jgi:hypothetical protein
LENSKRKLTFCSKNCLELYKIKKKKDKVSCCINCDKELYKDIASSEYIKIKSNNYKVHFCSGKCEEEFDIKKCKSNTYIKIKIINLLLLNFFNNNYQYLPAYAQKVLNQFYDKHNEPLEVIYTSMLMSLQIFKEVEPKLDFQNDISRFNYFLAIVRDKSYTAKVIINKQKTIEKQIKNFKNEDTLDGKYIKTEDKALLQNVLKQLL